MQQTLINLSKAFVGESQARNRYTYYAKVAKKEGYEQISAIFTLTAEQEKTHAKRLFEHLQEIKLELGQEKEKIEIEAEVPHIYGNTQENLKAAIEGEEYEYKEMYPGFAETAKEEGLPKVAQRMLSIAKAEEHHAERYIKILEQLINNTFFKKETPVAWVCRECGYVHLGKVPPQKCPSCDHSQAYYQIKSEEY